VVFYLPPSFPRLSQRQASLFSPCTCRVGAGTNHWCASPGTSLSGIHFRLPRKCLGMQKGMFASRESRILPSWLAMPASIRQYPSMGTGYESIPLLLLARTPSSATQLRECPRVYTVAPQNNMANFGNLNGNPYSRFRLAGNNHIANWCRPNPWMQTNGKI
jgi:hypothetical protein